MATISPDLHWFLGALPHARSVELRIESPDCAYAMIYTGVVMRRLDTHGEEGLVFSAPPVRVELNLDRGENVYYDPAACSLSWHSVNAILTLTATLMD